MNPNPLLRRLGFSNTDRVVILHADDVGMCQASLTAFSDLWGAGVISSGAVMMPCSWSPAAAEFCRSHPGVDMGVHTTLTCEWDRYRWGPLSTRDPGSGLMDAEGCMHRSSEDAQAGAGPEAVQREIEIQVRRALEWGIDVTHIDTHMGTVAHPKFIPAYVQVALEHRLPAMIPRLDAAGLARMGLDAESGVAFAAVIMQLEEQGMPLVDGLASMPLDQPEGQIDMAKELLGGLPAGVTHFILHPSVDTPELRAIAPDWPGRVANYHAFMSGEIGDYLRNRGIHIVGYRALRNLMRSGE